MNTPLTDSVSAASYPDPAAHREALRKLCRELEEALHEVVAFSSVAGMTWQGTHPEAYATMAANLGQCGSIARQALANDKPSRHQPL